MQNRSEPPTLILSGRIVRILEGKVTQRGGDFLKALSLVDERPEHYDSETSSIADLLASVYHTDAGLTIPKDGRVYPLNVPIVVDESLLWKDAIEAVGENARFSDEKTAPTDYVWEVGEKYPAKEDAKPVPKNVILVCFGQSSNSPAWMKKATAAWAKENCCSSASPRTVFAIAEHLPDLRDKLSCCARVVSPWTCSSMRHPSLPNHDLSPDQYAVEVRWDVFMTSPIAHLRFIGNSFPAFYASDWFAFVRNEK